MYGDVMTVLCGNKTGNIRINVTHRRVRTTIFAVEKECVTYSECMSLALVM